MHASSLLRSVAVASVIAIAAASLTATPAAAAPVFFVAELESDTFAHDDGSDCTPTETSSPDVTEEVVENGPAVTYTGSGSATYQNDTVPEDTASVNTTGSLTGKITSIGSSLGTIDVTAQGTGTITTALPTSDCFIHAGVGADAGFVFLVGQAGWLTVEGDMTRNTYLTVGVSTPDEAHTEEMNYEFKQSSTRRIFLEPGLYALATEVYLDVSGSSTKSFAGSASLHAEFAVAGAQVEAPRGKGTTYVGLAARSCATNAVSAVVTDNVKRAGRINFVAFFVNDKKVLRDDNPKKGEAYSLPVAGDADAEVTARVKLKSGKRPWTRRVSSSYIACS